MMHPFASMQVCFKCGQKGHWAAECKATQSLSDAVDLTWCVTNTTLLDPATPALPPVLRPEAAAACGLGTEGCEDGPWTSRAPAEGAAADAALARLLQDDFGFADFRHFQLRVVRAILQVRCKTPAQLALHSTKKSAPCKRNRLAPCQPARCERSASRLRAPAAHVRIAAQGKSCMVVQPTGSGKSLCYQLPALLLPGLALVVSPLTAHVRDAIAKVPARIPAGICLGGEFKRASTVRARRRRNSATQPSAGELRIAIDSLLLAVYLGGDRADRIAATCRRRWRQRPRAGSSCSS
jgi:Zinc knuckle